MTEPNINFTIVNSPQPDANQFLFITSLQGTLKDFPQFQLQFSHHYLHIYIGATHNLSFSPRIAKMYDRGNHKNDNT